MFGCADVVHVAMQTARGRKRESGLAEAVIATMVPRHHTMP